MTERASKLRVGILFGGESAEHEVSLQSALNVVQAIDREKYEVVLVGVDKRGRWRLADSIDFLRNAADPRLISLGEGGKSVALLPGQSSGLDVVFPVLHGPMGEDGSVQGLLRLAHIPFVGSGVLASAIAMDKDVSKRLLRAGGVPVARSLTLRRGSDPAPDFEELSERLGIPFFLKPANMGSSVGVHKVHEREGFHLSLADAFSYDEKVMAEEFIEGRELECSVLGNEEPMASVPGEVVAHHDFYSYEAKYLDQEGAELKIPAELPAEMTGRVQLLAIQAFRILECEGMARVDFFLRNDGELLVNEVNTIPGFTRISMYPKLWEASGIGYTELIDRLLQLALQRDRRERRFRASTERVPVEGKAR